MRIALMASAVALVVAGIAGTPAPASAAGLSVNLDVGGVAFGYSDGYWDRSHQWHSWGPGESRYYRAHGGGSHYVGHAHTREKGDGYRKEYWNHDDHGHR